MPNKEDALIVEKFTKFFIECLEDVMTALPAFVPQSEKDKHLFKKGFQAIDNIIYDLRHAESIRDIAQYIDVDKVLRDFDEESISKLPSHLGDLASHLKSEISESLVERGNDE